MKHNWEYKRLGDVASYINGYAFKPTDWGTEGYPIIRIQNLNNPSAEYNYFNGNIPQKYFIYNGDLLISWSASLGSYIWSGNKAVLNQHIFKVVFDKININKLYLHYFVDSSLPLMASKTHGATMRHITKPLFDSIQIPVPPMAVQEQIVAELDKLNEMIATRKEQLKELDNLAQSLFYDTFGDPISNPKGWHVKKIQDVCTLKSGDSSANKLPPGSTPYVKVGDMNLPENKSYIVTSSNFVNTEGKSKMLFPIGTTIFPKRGGAIFTNKKRLTKVEICCDLNVMGAIPTTISSFYLYYYFLLLDFANLVDGSTVPQINNGDIYPLDIPIPPLTLQHQFASQVEAIERQKKIVEASISDLQTLLDSRMDYWFN